MKKRFVIFIPLVLSGFIHLTNPVGFPDIFFDEGIYMRRAMSLLETGNPQEGYLYDHPYFGPIVLAGILYATNFQQITPATDPDSLQSMYMIPRIFMGLVAVLNTFLVYQIAKERFDRRVALLSSTLFAVMPYTWIFNRILLDSLLLPFLLASILLAVHFAKLQDKIMLAPIAGSLLGLAIFTKISAFMFIPLVAWLIFQKRRKYLDVLLFIIPVLVIPLLWPANSIVLDQFDLWIKDLLWQTQRSNSILYIVSSFLLIDPVLFVIGILGVAYLSIKRSKLALLWFAPFVAFLSLIGFKQYFHWIPLIPILCIGASVWLLDLQKHVYFQSQMFHRVIIVSILVFGFTSTVLIISNNVSSDQFEALSYILENQDDDTTILASPAYSWILYYVFDMEHVPKDYAVILFELVETKRVIVMADSHFMLDRARGDELEYAYNNTQSIKYFEGRIQEFDTRIYPYTNIIMNQDGGSIDIRAGRWR